VNQIAQDDAQGAGRGVKQIADDDVEDAV